MLTIDTSFFVHMIAMLLTYSYLHIMVWWVLSWKKEETHHF